MLTNLGPFIGALRSQSLLFTPTQNLAAAIMAQREKIPTKSCSPTHPQEGCQRIYCADTTSMPLGMPATPTQRIRWIESKDSLRFHTESLYPTTDNGYTVLIQPTCPGHTGSPNTAYPPEGVDTQPWWYNPQHTHSTPPLSISLWCQHEPVT